MEKALIYRIINIVKIRNVALDAIVDSVLDSIAIGPFLYLRLLC